MVKFTAVCTSEFLGSNVYLRRLLGVVVCSKSVERNTNASSKGRVEARLIRIVKPH